MTVTGATIREALAGALASERGRPWGRCVRRQRHECAESLQHARRGDVLKRRQPHPSLLCRSIKPRDVAPPPGMRVQYHLRHPHRRDAVSSALRNGNQGHLPRLSRPLDAAPTPRRRARRAAARALRRRIAAAGECCARVGSIGDAAVSCSSTRGCRGERPSGATAAAAGCSAAHRRRGALV